MTDAPLPQASFGVPTGIAALDDILAGGYETGRVHLIEGRPGSGKTTLALQFLLAARERGERALYVTLSESGEELRKSAATHGWNLEGIEIFELVPAELSLDPSREQSVVYASDLELGETVSLVMEAVERIKPRCIVFDSLSDIRLLAATSLRYGRQVLALKHFFARNGATTLFVDDLTEEMDDANLHSLVHGVIRLEQLTIAFGAERRRLRVHKMRGRAFRGGFHDYVIRRGGLQVFTRLVAADHKTGPEDAEQPVASGIAELDRMLGGGLERGTSSLIMGPAGSGKSTFALQYAMTAVKRNERAVFISFDETRRNFLRRANGLGIRPDQVPEALFTFQQVDPAELSPGELAGLVRAEVLERGARVVVLDSLSGYQHAMSEEQFMLLQMHELLTFLNQRDVLTILVLAQHGIVGPMQSPVDLTYLSDTVLLLRFFEAAGEMRRAISVMKKRTGGHESLIREYRIDSKGIRVGGPLRRFSGVLTGVPRYAGEAGELLADRGG
ncbi:ATPase domain-containing protein [Sabulicella glaciei]|uniref:non-specific serine/threonine protein kinase n=1 Tax=Sabulicella glaciei TaxID=2984948 RepID=A0ABT3NRH4_9PROT|nr:ATPase domain-containing protein [Roseococcus sp. MDT2-1-1]MCW8084765.1 AAA family ATPase [Roseococcus sp. MDT2-1-1]